MNDTTPNIDNQQRLATLQQLGLMDTEPELAFDRITLFATKLLRTPIALVSLVDAQRQFFKSSHGLPEPWVSCRETPLSHSFCQHVVAAAAPLLVEDARLHPLVATNPAIDELGFIAYAGVPLRTSDGQILGSFAVIDSTPRAWTADDVDILNNLASLVMTEIELRRDIIAHAHLEERLAIQYEITRSLVEAESLDQAAAAILRIIGETLQWQLGILWIIDPADNQLHVQEIWKKTAERMGEFEAASRSTHFERGVGIPGRIWANDAPIWIGNLLNDGYFPRLAAAAQAGLHSAFGIPVRANSGIVGIMEFFSAEIRAPKEDILSMVMALGNQIGQFIDRQRAQQELRNSEARKTAILESALDCIISIDHTGCITEFNPAAERTFGYRREAVIGQQMADLIVPAHMRGRHRQGLATYVATGEAHILGKRIELSAVRADGSEFPVELTVTRIPISGQPMFTGYIRDITEQKHIEQERADLLHREQAARADAERAVHTRDEFLSIASHELKTPITSLLGYTQLLQRRLGSDENIDTRAVRALHVIQEQSQRLARLVDQLLDISRIATGHFTLSLQALDLCLVVRGVVESVEPSLERHTIDFRCGSETVIITADELRLEQVVQNLVQNAIKYSPDGGVISIWLAREGDSVLLTISDQGIGIPEAAQPHLFQRFYRASNVDGSNISGFGIGLYVVQEIVQRHGGTIAIQSVEGLGSTFAIRLPLP